MSQPVEYGNYKLSIHYIDAKGRYEPKILKPWTDVFGDNPVYLFLSNKFLYCHVIYEPKHICKCPVVVIENKQTKFYILEIEFVDGADIKSVNAKKLDEVCEFLNDEQLKDGRYLDPPYGFPIILAYNPLPVVDENLPYYEAVDKGLGKCISLCSKIIEKTKPLEKHK